MTYASEQELITAMIQKDDAAFRQAIREYQSSMLYLAKSLIGPRFADEVVQEAWVSAMRALDRFEGRSSLKTWLLRVVANEAKTRLRRENRHVSLEAVTGEGSPLNERFTSDGHWGDQVPVEWELDTPDDILASSELKQCIDEMITTLPDMQSATLNLREQQDYSLKEICNILDISESNVRVLLHRARNKLFKCIEHFQATGECCTSETT